MAPKRKTHCKYGHSLIPENRYRGACRACRKIRDDERRKAGKRKKVNTDKNREYVQRYLAKYPEREAEIHRRYKYGIEPEEYKAKFEEQGRRCPICGTDGTEFKKGPGNGWRTDHCHTTGKFRGILCHPCNVAIGFAKDDPDILLRAAQYLSANR